MMCFFPGFVWCFCLFCFFGFVLVVLFVLGVVLRVVAIAYGQYLDCVWVHALF